MPDRLWKVITGYRPNRTNSDWARVRPFVIECVLRMKPRSLSNARRLMTMTALYVSWAWAVAGCELAGERVFVDALVHRYLATRLRKYSAVYRFDTARQLSAISETLTGEPTGRLRTPFQSLRVAPYSPAQVAALYSWANTLSTPLKQQNARPPRPPRTGVRRRAQQRWENETLMSRPSNMPPRPEPLLSVEGVRGWDEFSLDPQKRHINHGSYGAVPTRTLAHQAELKRAMESNTLRWFEELPPKHAAVRRALAPFVGAPAEEIAMVMSASAAASVVYKSIPLAACDEVLLTDHIYGAVAMGAERYARQWGASVRRVPVPHQAQAEETLAAILAEVNNRTRIVVVDHISSATARVFPVQELVDALADRDVIVVIDGAHALGILPKSAVRAPKALWFGNLHKYPCAPRGAAVLVAQGELAQRLVPLIDSWGAEFAFPSRFDLQGAIDSTSFLASVSAIESLESLFGWGRIRDYSTELGRWATAIIAPELAQLMDADPLGAATPSSAGPVPDVGMPLPEQPLLRLPPGVAADGPSARLLKDRLTAEADCEVGVSSWNGTGYIRISAHVYNEAGDYEQFVERGIPVIASLV